MLDDEERVEPLQRDGAGLPTSRRRRSRPAPGSCTAAIASRSRRGRTRSPGSATCTPPICPARGPARGARAGPAGAAPRPRLRRTRREGRAGRAHGDERGAAPTADRGRPDTAATALGLGDGAGGRRRPHVRGPARARAVGPGRHRRHPALRRRRVRTAPVDLDALRAALDGNAGLVVESLPGSPGALRVELLPTRADVDRKRGTPTATALGSVFDDIGDFFSDAWDGIISVATSAYDLAKQAYEGAVKIRDQRRGRDRGRDPHRRRRGAHRRRDDRGGRRDVVSFLEKLALKL